MSQPEQVGNIEEFIKVESIFVRHRNALMLRAKFAPIYTDYYLHLMQHGIRHAPELDQMLKDFLACITLHAVARPWAETVAWTVNLRAPRVNLFATAGSLHESVTGRLFTEDVREPDRNFFYSQVTAQHMSEPRLSTLEVDERDPLSWVEQFYARSEQRPARMFRHEDELFSLVTAQPDCDEEWLAKLDTEAAERIEDTEETSLLETRRFHFHCGCDLGKILPILGSWRDRPDELFDGADYITVQCPRCAARYEVTRDMI
ncbi:Hsp33 family molecular chaperone HslO [Luteolibacter marinus]|uniref:Hsp33 family molecular chaperone HslO n=1 Tax=Luteolibacter marinus TaxID=2776705 RepID=UPI001D021F94|nr:disulfide bond chaperone [Luteolibacter marinus]